MSLSRNEGSSRRAAEAPSEVPPLAHLRTFASLRFISFPTHA